MTTLTAPVAIDNRPFFVGDDESIGITIDYVTNKLTLTVPDGARRYGARNWSHRSVDSTTRVSSSLALR